MPDQAPLADPATARAECGSPVGIVAPPGPFFAANLMVFAVATAIIRRARRRPSLGR
jgi:hypothetical protein